MPQRPARYGSDRSRTQQRLDVPFDTPVIDCQRARFLLHPARQESASFGVGKIRVAKLRHSFGVTLCMLIGSRIGVLCNLAQQPFSLLACGFGCPRRSMPANGEPALAPFPVTIKQYVRDGLAPLATYTKTG
jgi:hypothetical protein